MQQAIIGFHQDELHDWVAELACGHNQHTRHHPPLVNRPWVTHEEGRNPMLGEMLNCKKWDEGAKQDF